jgi:hypothetical protein
VKKMDRRGFSGSQIPAADFKTISKRLFVFMRYQISLAVLVLLGTLCGCSGSSVESQVAAMNSNNIKRITNLYCAYQLRNGYTGPKDLATLKGFTEHGLEPQRLEMMKIKPEEFDKLTVSERDGKPFKIRFSVHAGPLDPAAAVVFEDAGVDGVRQVGFTNSKIQDADDAQYKELWGGKPAASAEGGQPADNSAKSKG